LEKSSGRLFVRVTSDTKMRTLVPIIKDKVKEGSNVNTDE
jgi:transposase-like protein